MAEMEEEPVVEKKRFVGLAGERENVKRMSQLELHFGSQTRLFLDWGED